MAGSPCTVTACSRSTAGFPTTAATCGNRCRRPHRRRRGVDRARQLAHRRPRRQGSRAREPAPMNQGAPARVQRARRRQGRDRRRRRAASSATRCGHRPTRQIGARRRSAGCRSTRGHEPGPERSCFRDRRRGDRAGRRAAAGRRCRRRARLGRDAGDDPVGRRRAVVRLRGRDERRADARCVLGAPDQRRYARARDTRHGRRSSRSSPPRSRGTRRPRRSTSPRRSGSSTEVPRTYLRGRGSAIKHLRGPWNKGAGLVRRL